MKKIFREIVNLTVVFHIKRFRKDRILNQYQTIFLNSITKSTNNSGIGSSIYYVPKIFLKTSVSNPLIYIPDPYISV